MARSWPPTLRFLLPPHFLCPLLTRSSPRILLKTLSQVDVPQRRHGGPAVIPRSASDVLPTSILPALPLQCPGCGAYTQETDPRNAGFYSTNRKSVKAYLSRHEAPVGLDGTTEVDVFGQVLRNADTETLQSLGLENSPTDTSAATVETSTPVCNRCHDLIHHHAGAPIVHPTLASIQAIISESPYKYNHVYHVLDAADFPLSLIPRLHHYLSLTPQRSSNRRSKTSKYYYGRKAELSFIITRSDLLAPRKEQVDGLMPYLVEVLRDALGRAARDVRLGNVRCVSSKRGWWTKEVKEAIWERGGGGWMVGKVNVGKSNLFECIFPKGKNEEVDYQTLQRAADSSGSKVEGGVTVALPGSVVVQEDDLFSRGPRNHKSRPLSEYALLPPAPPEERFPAMPTVSSLPGTTASPIRLLFGKGKGELIDLPGLARGNLEDNVLDEYKEALVMQQRVKPEGFSVKSGQSLLVGGIIRITPTDPDLVMLAYPFIPIKCHVTSTEKAIDLQTQRQTSNVQSIAKPGTGNQIRSAGIFQLRWDITRQRTGPLTRPSAMGLKPQALPFVVYSADLLIEGCGWIELVAQVRKRGIESLSEQEQGGSSHMRFPQVEVFSPHGENVGIRRPMNAWLLGGPKPVSVARRASRPRPSMKGAKKNMKRAARAAAEA